MSACRIRVRRRPTVSTTSPRLIDYQTILLNTLMVTFAATIMAIAFGFVMAWILTRTNVPFKNTLDQLMTVPYYVTPLLGALAWSLLGAPESGFINQIWRALGGSGALIDITSPLGIAWVMALFEGSVAYVMIGAVMQSMDPALEEASQMAGAGRLTTIWRVTLPLVTPGLLGATIFVFAEMLGSFSAALVLGTPSRFYVITTAIYQLVSQNPPRVPLAAAMGVSLFAVMFVMLYLYRRITSRGNYVTVSGKAFRPRTMDLGWLRWVMFAACVLYVVLSVILPVGTLIFAAVQKLAVAFPKPENFTLDNFRQALTINAVRTAMGNSLVLAAITATLGVALTGFLTWIIQSSPDARTRRARVPGDVPASGAASRVRLRHDVGVAGVPAAGLRNVLGAADCLLDRVHAARRAGDLRRCHAVGQEPRRVRAGLRCILDLSFADDHRALVETGSSRGLAAHFRCERS